MDTDLLGVDLPLVVEVVNRAQPQDLVVGGNDRIIVLVGLLQERDNLLVLIAYLARIEMGRQSIR